MTRVVQITALTACFFDLASYEFARGLNSTDCCTRRWTRTSDLVKDVAARQENNEGESHRSIRTFAALVSLKDEHSGDRQSR